MMTRFHSDSILCPFILLLCCLISPGCIPNLDESGAKCPCNEETHICCNGECVPIAKGCADLESRSNVDADTGTDVDTDMDTDVDTDTDTDTVACGDETSPISFPDANLEAAVREALGNPTGDMYCDDLDSLEVLDVKQVAIWTLTGIEWLKNLDYAVFVRNGITDISPIGRLTKLEYLAIVNNNVDDISPIANLSNLEVLQVDNNFIDDISPLSNLVALSTVTLIDNDIEDISPIAGLSNLTHLNLGMNIFIEDISPIAGLSNLTYLSLGRNWYIEDISPIAGLSNLTYLDLGTNRIVDIAPLINLSNLTYLNLGSNQIVDISPLVDNVGLNTYTKEKVEIDLSDNSLDCGDETTLGHIATLEARGVTLVHDFP